MSNLKVSSQAGSYEIHLHKFVEVDSGNGLTVVDSKVPNTLVGPSASHLTLEISEQVKTLSTVEGIILALKEAGTTRAGQLVAVGGGAIQDLATLSASLYMRGIEWIYYPTTLASMVDSCVGGKSSINLSGYKNVIGNFYPPKKVIIDTRFIDSLPEAEYLCGLAEGVKICFAKGEPEFEDFIGNAAAHGKTNPEDSRELVSLCLTSKKWFVEIDEHDKKERQLLNFGHSFGHALESASDFRIPHGIAVGIGMLAATNPRWGSLHTSTKALRNYLLSILAKWPNKEPALGKIAWNVFEDTIRHDKKNTNASVRLILSNGAGSLFVSELPKSEETFTMLTEVAVASVKEVQGN
jgi:3-dehydroquinate synthase